MNPQGGPAGQANANNQNEVILHLSLDLESLSLLPKLPLFPVTAESLQRFNDVLPQPQMNIPQLGAVVPLHEFPNVALGSNVSSSRSPNMNPSNNNVAPPRHAVQGHGMRGGASASLVHLPTKRSFSDHAFKEFHVGESSKMGEQAALAKRRAT